MKSAGYQRTRKISKISWPDWKFRIKDTMPSESIIRKDNTGIQRHRNEAVNPFDPDI